MAIGAGIALGVAVLVAAKIGAAAVLVLIGVILVAATFELYETLRTRGYHPATFAGTGRLRLDARCRVLKGEDAMPLVLGLFVVFSFLWYLGGVVHARPAMNVAVTVMAFMYVGFLGSFAALLLRIPGVTSKGVLAHDGITLFLLPVIATIAYDVGGFAIGSRTGRTPLAPSVSPNKTVEGTVGATIATVVVTLLVVAVFKLHPWTLGRAFWLAAVVCVAAPLGDLCESMIKRDLGVKDMGTVLPGPRRSPRPHRRPPLRGSGRLLPAARPEVRVGSTRVRTVALVGSTGSIGTQAVDVIKAEPDRYRVVALGASTSIELLATQAHELRPERVAIADAELAPKLEELVPPALRSWAGPSPSPPSCATPTWSSTPSSASPGCLSPWRLSSRGADWRSRTSSR